MKEAGVWDEKSMENKRKGGGEAGEAGGGWVWVELWGEGSQAVAGARAVWMSGNILRAVRSEGRPETWCGCGAAGLLSPLRVEQDTAGARQTLALEACTPGSGSRACEQSTPHRRSRPQKRH